MRTGALVLASLLAAGGAAAAQGRQSGPDTPLILEVGVRGYLAGGQMGSMAGDTATDRLESYVWADQTLCGMGAGDEAPRNTPAVGWHFIAMVTDRSPGQLTVRVEWRRMWDRGVRAPNSAGATRSLTIRSGERVELDRVAASGEGRCGTVEAKLEASVLPRPAYLLTGVRGGMAGAGGRGVSRPQVGGEPAGTAAGVASGTGRGVGSGSGRGVASGGGGRGGASGTGSGRGGDVPETRPTTGGRGGRGGATGGGTYGGTSTTEQSVTRGGRGGAAGGSTTTMGRGVSSSTVEQTGRGGRSAMGYTGLGAYDAEVWLVHKQQGGAESVQQQTLRFGPGARDFAFPPIQVSSRGEPITIDITGRLQSLGGRYALATAPSGASGEYLLAYRQAQDFARQVQGQQPGRQGQGQQGQGQRGQQGQGRQGGAGLAFADPSQPPMFVVLISRRARRASPFIDTRGATDMAIEIPKPSDVLSFELPPLQKETEDLLRGHTFSIRLRVTPVK